jgi:hypothetical protein
VHAKLLSQKGMIIRSGQRKSTGRRSGCGRRTQSGRCQAARPERKRLCALRRYCGMSGRRVLRPGDLSRGRSTGPFQPSSGSGGSPTVAAKRL